MEFFKYHKYNGFIIIVCLLISGKLVAQGIGPLGHMPTPHAADLGRFGDIPVSYYTGRANVTVPIQSFTRRGVTLDISLSYDTSGLPINKLPGWVGPGWTLNAGGVITRLRQNYCDEMTFRGTYIENLYSNYFNSYSDIVSEGSPNISYLRDPDNYTWHDYSPDIFYFNFMGKSGSFFLGTDGEWKVSSDDNLVVEFDFSASDNFISPIFTDHLGEISYKHPNAIKGFTIFDEYGNQYHFGGNNESIEYSTDLFHTSNEETSEPWVATAWYLTSVNDRNGMSLYTFSYEHGSYLVQLYRTPFSANSLAYSGTLNLPTYLSSINVCNNAYITFSMESPYQAGMAARALYPSVYNSNGTPKSLTPGYNPNCQYPFFYLQASRQDVLNYNVLSSPIFTDPLSGMDIQFLKEICINPLKEDATITYKLNYENLGRYHLKSISAEDAEGRIYKHSFNYYNYPGITPDYLTDQHDYWGYYNKAYIPNTGMQEPDDPEYIGQGESGQGGGSGQQEIPIDSVRKPDLNNAMMGMLKEIIYPSGGKTVLDYELNNYSLIQTEYGEGMAMQSGTAGGLRIKSITEFYDSLGTTVSTQRLFSYLHPITEVSSGQLIKNEGQEKYYEFRLGNTQMVLSPPIIPLGTTMGTHIGYSYVTETVDGISRRFHYTNFSNALEEVTYMNQPGQPEMDPYENNNAYSSFRFLQGRLLDETVYNCVGDTLQRIKYNYRTDRNVYMLQFSYGFNNILCMNTPENLFVTVANKILYKLYYPKYDVAQIIKSTAFGSQMVNDTTFFTMQTYDQLLNDWETKPFFRKCVSERTVRGNTSYTKNYTYTPYNRYFIPLTSTCFIDNSTVEKTEITQYALFNGIPQPQYEIIQYGNESADTLVEYHGYEIKGNIHSYTMKGEYTTNLFWKPMTDRLLASVTGPLDRTAMNCPAQALGYTGGSALHVVELASDNQTIFSHPEIRATTYVYDTAGRLTSSATGNGIVTYYLYDYLGRLTEIQDADHNTLQRFTYNYSTSATQ